MAGRKKYTSARVRKMPAESRMLQGNQRPGDTDECGTDKDP